MLKKKELIKLALLLFVFTSCQNNQDNKEGQTAVTKKEDIVTKTASQTVEKAPAPSSNLIKAPDFNLKKVSDESGLTLSELAGKVVIIDFWATWCPPCKASIPKLNILYKKYKDKGLEIVGVSLDEIRNFQDQEKLKAFITKFSMEYPIVYINQETREKFGGVSAIPTIFIVNKEGMIVDSFKGFSEDIEAQIEKNIKQSLGI